MPQSAHPAQAPAAAAGDSGGIEDSAAASGTEDTAGNTEGTPIFGEGEQGATGSAVVQRGSGGGGGASDRERVEGGGSGAGASAAGRRRRPPILLAEQRQHSWGERWNRHPHVAQVTFPHAGER